MINKTLAVCLVSVDRVKGTFGLSNWKIQEINPLGKQQGAVAITQEPVSVIERLLINPFPP